MLLYALVLCKLIPTHIYKAQLPMEINYYALWGGVCMNIFKKIDELIPMRNSM